MNEKMLCFERSVNQILFYSVLGIFYESNSWDYEFENSIFRIQEYNEDNDEPNLYHKPSGFKLWWYKYPLRSPVVNMDITHEEFLAILYDCKDSLGLNHVSYYKWWKQEEENASS